MKKFFIFLVCSFLGSILGFSLFAFWYSGGNTFWKPINYFPYPVQNILALQGFGKEFWVETKDNEIYQIIYPCLNDQTCWIKVDNIPSLPEEVTVAYKVSDNKCDNGNFVYPLPHPIRICLTSMVLAEVPWITSLALTDNHQLWIWDKPWFSQGTQLFNFVLSIALGAMIGILLGKFWNQKLVRI